MSRDLSLKEKELLNKKVPKALSKGRKSDDTKVEANKVLTKAGYEEYFNIEGSTLKKRKLLDTCKAPSIYPVKAASSSGRGDGNKSLKVNKLLYMKLYFVKIF